jgi:hypothetical protein
MVQVLDQYNLMCATAIAAHIKQTMGSSQERHAVS